MSQPQTLSMLERRRIEAVMLGHVYETLKASHGKEAAAKAIADSVRRASIARDRDGERGWRQDITADVHRSPGALDARQCADDRREGAIGDEIRVQRHPLRIRAHVSRDGLGEIGHLLSCQRDGTFCEGYDPKLKLQRTQTIMQGASHCDFEYTYEEKPASG